MEQLAQPMINKTHNACEKKRQGAASFLLVRHDDGLQREMPVIGKALGMLFRKLAHDWLDGSVGGVSRI